MRNGGGAERFERMGVRVVSMQTTATAADAALLLADAAGATPIIGVGLRGTVEEFLDGSREGIGSGYVTRLKVGPRLVDATAVPMLYSGQLRARHAYLVLLDRSDRGLLRRSRPPTSATSGRSICVTSSTSSSGEGCRDPFPFVRRPSHRRPPGPGHRCRPRGRSARRHPVGRLDRTAASSRRRRTPTYADAFAASVAPRLYADGLSRRPVALVTMPGADPATVTALASQIKAAGGQVAGTYAVQGQLVDARQKSLVDTLGIQLAKQVRVPGRPPRRRPIRASGSSSRSRPRTAARPASPPGTTLPPSGRAWRPPSS